jgi:hypothetical protein
VPEKRSESLQDVRASSMALPSAAWPTAPSITWLPITHPGVPSMPMRSASAMLERRN